jgi:hypothetical protein
MSISPLIASFRYKNEVLRFSADIQTTDSQYVDKFTKTKTFSTPIYITDPASQLTFWDIT